MNGRFFLHQVLHCDDSPHRLALGAALGTLVAFTPTIGFQMAIVVLLAWSLRANKAIGVPLVWISNPLTIPPIFFIGYTLGRLLIGWPPLDYSWWAALRTPPVGWWSATWFYWSRTVEIAGPLWLGCLLMGLLASIPAYALVFNAAKRLHAGVEVDCDRTGVLPAKLTGERSHRRRPLLP
ncbi:MAG: DUF2062 domain-containing protein [Rhodopirellula sp.]|nr:DUF2062 domain-containing protein [Rhodopirellula sp.]